MEIRIFVGGKPLDDMTPQERQEVATRVVEAMGKVLEDA